MTNSTELGLIIRAARKKKKLSQDNLAELVGVKQSTVSEWESGAYYPSRNVFEKLRHHLGLGDFAVGEHETPERMVDVNDDLPDIVTIPEFSLVVAAGGGAVIDDQAPKGYWPWSRNFFESLNISPSRCVVLTVSGDSMEPTLRSGDRVLVDTEKTNPAQSGVFVLAMNDLAVVKRVEMVPGSKPVMLRISSDNPLHKAYEASAEDIQIIGWPVVRVSRM